MNEAITFDSSYLAQLELLRLESRKKFLGSRQGGHLSLKKGHGIEFSDYRQYELGDNPRYIDWKAYGRTDKLYVKQFQEEQDLLVSVFLDSSPSMGFETDPEKWDFACRVALSFCYLGLMQEDKVALSLLGKAGVLTLSGPQAFPHFSRRISQVINGGGDSSQVRASSETPISFGQAMRLAALQTKFPGVAVVVSDFHCSLEEINDGFKPLRSRNQDIVALQILGKRDLEPLSKDEFSQMLDSETGETFDLEFNQERAQQLAGLVRTHSEKCREYFRQRQIGFTSLQSGQDIISTLRKSQQSLRVLR